MTRARDSTLPPALLSRVQRRLADGQLQPTPDVLAELIRTETDRVISDAELLGWLRAVERELLGAGPLSGLLEDPDVTDVVVNGPADVRLDRGDGWENARVTFPDDASVSRLARRLAAAAGRRLDDAHPFVDGWLPGGVRLHAILRPVAPDGTHLSLRVLRPIRDDLATLATRGTLPGLTASVLTALIRSRTAFLISGGTGAGKTTLLSALLATVDPAERIVVVEDAEELAPPHPHLVRLIARPPNVEGAGAIELRQLVRQALRMRPDRIVVGEVRGPEIVEMLTALNTGHQGGAGTLHANAASEVPARVEALAAQAGLGRDAVHAQLAGAFGAVLHVSRSGTHRVLSEVAVVRRLDSGQLSVCPAVIHGVGQEPGVSMLREVLQCRNFA